MACTNFLHLIFPCANIFFFVLRPHPPHKFSNGPPCPPLSLIQISSQGRSVAEIKKRKYGGSDLQRPDGSAHTKKDIRQAVMSILRRAWAKYQQLLITHPWKTQTIGTGIVINEIPFLDRFEETSPHSNHLSEVMSSKNPKLNCCEISLNLFTDRVVGA